MSQTSEQITYRQEGDFLIPDLTLGSQPNGRLGKYGLMRRKYLMNHRRGMYNHLLLLGILTATLLEVDREAREMMESLTASLLHSNPLPQTNDTMELAAHRNGILHRAEEMVLNDLIYS